MIEIFGELYYIDFEILDKFLIIDRKNNSLDGTETITETVNVSEYFDGTGTLVSKEIITNDNIREKEINGVKFEIIRSFIDDLGHAAELSSDDYDSALGSRNLKNMPLRFKLAFNTLVYYNILNKVD